MDLVTVCKNTLEEPVVIRMSPFQLSRLIRINKQAGLGLNINQHPEAEEWSANDVLENLGMEEHLPEPPDDGSDERYENWKDAA